MQILGDVEQLNREAWQHTLDVNVQAPFFWTQALLPELTAARGCVVNIGSIRARLTSKAFVAYTTSKAALAGMTLALAVELGARVRVNAIEPAAINTKMLKASFGDNQEAISRLGDHHPTLRIGQPAEVGRLALLMVDNGLPFLNGAVIGLDGGIASCLPDPGLCNQS